MPWPASPCACAVPDGIRISPAKPRRARLAGRWNVAYGAPSLYRGTADRCSGTAGRARPVCDRERRCSAGGGGSAASDGACRRPDRRCWARRRPAAAGTGRPDDRSRPSAASAARSTRRDERSGHRHRELEPQTGPRSWPCVRSWNEAPESHRSPTSIARKAVVCTAASLATSPANGPQALAAGQPREEERGGRARREQRDLGRVVHVAVPRGARHPLARRRVGCRDRVGEPVSERARHRRGPPWPRCGEDASPSSRRL